MLSLLRVRQFAIIDRLDLELGPGLNVVTGETGAGKSILVHALQLVLGAKGRGDVVRTGSAAAEVEALFDVRADPVARARLDAAGLHGDDDELLVRRVVQANGRTRAYVNGRLATAAQLAQLARGLVDISSQHEHHGLVDPGRHLDFLDAFGRHDHLRIEVARAHADLAAAAAALRAAEDENPAEREDFLRFQLREIDDLAPEPGEDDRLAGERERLRHAERLASVAGQAEAALYADDHAACTLLARVQDDLRDAVVIDPSLSSLAEQMTTVRAQLEELALELGRYARDVTVDPDRLAEVEERLDRIQRLKRKYGGDIDGVLAHRQRVEAELDALDAREQRLLELRARRDRAAQAAGKVAKRLRAARRKAATALGEGIGTELRGLGMGDARVVVDVAPLVGRDDDELAVDGARLTPTGADRVEFLIAPNRGEEPRPLRKIASGGELSRAMLAIKRVLADVGDAGVYVFDEVDAGVGGAVAETIGRKLEDVAGHHQVLCITHLPQIAVYADRHFRVQKEVADDDRTRSTVVALRTETDRLEEVARMLGGLRVTDRTRAAAAEMLRGASANSR
jgi:DNA repair protein RecN (Recombination protein N)